MGDSENGRVPFAVTRMNASSGPFAAQVGKPETLHIEQAKASCDTLQVGLGFRFDELPLPRVLELPVANLPKAAAAVRESFDKLIDSLRFSPQLKSTSSLSLLKLLRC